MRRGPVPADDSAEWTYIVDSPNRKKPLVDLPANRGTDDEGGSIPWHPQTTAWWNTMRALPHTAEWRTEDWHALVGLAYVADTVYTATTPTAHAEWRRGSDALGLTAEARRKLRIKLVPAALIGQFDPSKAPPKKTPARKPAAAPPAKTDRRRQSVNRD